MAWLGTVGGTEGREKYIKSGCMACTKHNRHLENANAIHSPKKWIKHSVDGGDDEVQRNGGSTRNLEHKFRFMCVM